MRLGGKGIGSRKAATNAKRRVARAELFRGKGFRYKECAEKFWIAFFPFIADFDSEHHQQMHRIYFPACPVEGAIEPPVPFNHFGLEGAIPNKCGGCRNSFEGGCIRFFDEVQRYMHLDFGPCGINGPTDPVTYEDKFIKAKVEVPRKCASCHFLFYDNVFGFTCSKDSEKWGRCYRGLDWGAWSPDKIYLELPHPKVTTKILVDLAYRNELVLFIAEHRKINPGLSINESREDFSRFRELIDRRISETSGEGG